MYTSHEITTIQKCEILIANQNNYLQNHNLLRQAYDVRNAKYLHRGIVSALGFAPYLDTAIILNRKKSSLSTWEYITSTFCEKGVLNFIGTVG